METFKSLKLNYDWLFEKKVAVGIIDTSEKINSDLLRSVSKNIIDYWFEDIATVTNEDYDIEKILNINSDPDSLIEWANNNNYEYILITSLGITFKNTGPEFFTVLEKFLNETTQDDITIVGHILDKQHEYYQLHHQTFLINLDWWRKNNKPKIGYENQQPKTLTVISRSRENHHDNYTPLWIEKGQGTKQYSKTHFGWNIIETAVQSGKRVHSFNSELRRSKYYLYPEVNSDAHTKQHHITKWITSMNKHFIANTESFSFNFQKDFDSLLCSAGGISPLLISYGLNLKPKSQVVVTDINYFALLCQKKLTDALVNKTITVEQIESFLLDLAHSFSIENEKEKNKFELFNGSNKIKDMQKEINKHSQQLQAYVDTVLPTLRITYKKFDYLDDSNSVVNRIEQITKESKSVYLNISNIFHYYPTALLYSYEQRNNLFQRLLRSLDKANPNKYYTTMFAVPINKLFENNSDWFHQLAKTERFNKIKPKWKK